MQAATRPSLSFPQVPRRWGWRPALALIPLTFLGWGVTSDAWHDLCRGPSSVPVVWAVAAAAWLFWARRARIRGSILRKRLVGLGLASAGWLVYSYGRQADLALLWHGGAVVVLLGCSIVAFGLDLVQKFAPAMAVLFFAVPLPEGSLERAGAEIFGVLHPLAGLPSASAGAAEARELSAIGRLLARELPRIVFAAWIFAFSRPLRPGVRLAVLASAPLALLACAFLLGVALRLGLDPGGWQDLGVGRQSWTPWVAVALYVLVLEIAVERLAGTRWRVGHYRLVHDG